MILDAKKRKSTDSIDSSHAKDATSAERGITKTAAKVIGVMRIETQQRLGVTQNRHALRILLGYVVAHFRDCRAAKSSRNQRRPLLDFE